MPTPRPPQPTRFAIQKARGTGWKTLEVGEELSHAKARFDQMVGINPRAYFRLIQLDYNADSGYEGMEFNWTLIELYDPTKGLSKGPARDGRARPAPKPAAAARRKTDVKRKADEAVALPLRVYLAVILIGTLAGALAYLHFVGGR
ncbi:hypothetical protein TSH100_31560 [Azospirillum sp. TSH100]|uniref:hypothetical protein n=1 Tax=Azospirillum sp. TSH100 TaxID=652764 RepID=UPI000D60A9D1|nr:hypothetical protein [Azospirillum sp. TSH100]PWC73017.1 hypothetical protein TSH100_31560 [Azospirillum sp. TSH100]QCG92024.1 hypothetical protein E6C72_30090 [Azospirillum sp. TSH100]